MEYVDTLFMNEVLDTKMPKDPAAREVWLKGARSRCFREHCEDAPSSVAL
mgnify:CR=1 FL=1